MTASRSSSQPQTGILSGAPALARSLTFRLRHAPAPAAETLQHFVATIAAEWVTVGIGAPLALLLETPVAGLRTFPGLSGAGVMTPSTQGALWVLLRAENYTELYKREGAVRAALADGFLLNDARNLFHYDGGRDLSGFEDGTENPKDDAAERAALVADGPLAGSSFVAVQRWIHDLQRFAAFPAAQANNVIGRELTSNDELADAPPSAHVKRSAQESFEPPAFMVRRSMPWSDGEQHGLEFISFVNDLDTFETVMKKMLGLDDGIVDALFTFSHPITGSYYWCPPLRDGRLDLSPLGLGA